MFKRQQHHWFAATVTAWTILVLICGGALLFKKIPISRSWDALVWFAVLFLPQLIGASAYVKPLAIPSTAYKLFYQILWGSTLLMIPANTTLFYDPRHFAVMLFLAPLPVLIGSIFFLCNRHWLRGIGLLFLTMCCAFQTLLCMACQQ